MRLKYPILTFWREGSAWDRPGVHAVYPNGYLRLRGARCVTSSLIDSSIQPEVKKMLHFPYIFNTHEYMVLAFNRYPDAIPGRAQKMFVEVELHQPCLGRQSTEYSYLARLVTEPSKLGPTAFSWPSVFGLGALSLWLVGVWRQPMSRSTNIGIKWISHAIGIRFHLWWMEVAVIFDWPPHRTI